ncbi:hypothetical protein GW17_00039581 [Ensete ventricosum]|nr:hypothetical protein GW17_00039581 [Ensete ventricosum]
MLPLRFPNSGIRAKVFVQKIGFKLCVMRLNRVESFYAFLLRLWNKRSEERRQSAMARPSVGMAGHGQASCRGERLWPRPPCKGEGSRSRARPLTPRCSQGATASGQFTWGYRPRPRLPPAEATMSVTGATAS